MHIFGAKYAHIFGANQNGVRTFEANQSVRTFLEQIKVVRSHFWNKSKWCILRVRRPVSQQVIGYPAVVDLSGAEFRRGANPYQAPNFYQLPDFYQ